MVTRHHSTAMIGLGTAMKRFGCRNLRPPSPNKGKDEHVRHEYNVLDSGSIITNEINLFGLVTSVIHCSKNLFKHALTLILFSLKDACDVKDALRLSDCCVSSVKK